MTFGITLSNRGVLLGLTTVRELLALADAAEASPLIDAVWVGDALYVDRRIDAVTLLAAIAGRTERVLLGPACMGSFALRDPRLFAYQWASLDVLSHGRTRLVVCSGGGAGANWEVEGAVMGIDPKTRRRRMVENMQACRHLWTQDELPFEGQYLRFAGATCEPKPVQNPCPIWLATNGVRVGDGAGDAGGTPIALDRVGRHADGWMTHRVSPEGFADSWSQLHAIASEHGRDAQALDNVLYLQVNIADDRDAALDDATRHLKPYVGNLRPNPWGAFGPAADCVALLRRYRDAGCRRVAFRLSTAGDPTVQLRRLVEDVLPHVNA